MEQVTLRDLLTVGTIRNTTGCHIHNLMYRPLTGSGLRSIEEQFRLLLMDVVHQLETKFPTINIRYDGKWDTWRNTYTFYLRPVYEDCDPDQFVYGQIFVGSHRSMSRGLIVGYRLQIESICRFFPIGILDKQINQLNAYIQEAICGDTNLTVRELNEEFQDIYSHMECIGLVDGYPAFIKYLKENLEVCQTMQCYLTQYPKQRHLTLSFYGVLHEVPIKIKKHWYTLININ